MSVQEDKAELSYQHQEKLNETLHLFRKLATTIQAIYDMRRDYGCNGWPQPLSIHLLGYVELAIAKLIRCLEDEVGVFNIPRWKKPAWLQHYENDYLWLIDCEDRNKVINDFSKIHCILRPIIVDMNDE